MPKLIDKPIISADSHITEPRDLYKGRVARKYADSVPKLVRRPEGGEVFITEGLDDFPITLAAAAGLRGKAVVDQAFKDYDDCITGGWDPKQRLLDQDRDGIGGEVIYPSLGMFLCGHKDADYKSALFAAYNEWLAEFCSYAPDRLYGLGQTAVASPEAAIDDLRQIKTLGLRGVMLPGYPEKDDYDSRIYDPLWEAAVDLDLPLSIHVLTYKDGLGKPRGSKMNTFISVMRGNQDFIGTLLFGGVFERFPKLKVVCAEADAGWVPHYMSRIDHAVERTPHWLGDVKLSRKPSEYFWDNIYLTFQDDDVAFKMRHLLNIDHLMWANDFPHLDATWPYSQGMLAEQTADLDRNEKTKVLHDNVATLYGLDL